MKGNAMHCALYSLFVPYYHSCLETIFAVFRFEDAHCWVIYDPHHWPDASLFQHIGANRCVDSMASLEMVRIGFANSQLYYLVNR